MLSVAGWLGRGGILALGGEVPGSKENLGGLLFHFLSSNPAESS